MQNWLCLLGLYSLSFSLVVRTIYPMTTPFSSSGKAITTRVDTVLRLVNLGRSRGRDLAREGRFTKKENSAGLVTSVALSHEQFHALILLSC